MTAADVSVRRLGRLVELRYGAERRVYTKGGYRLYTGWDGCSQAGRFVHYKLSDRRVAKLLNLGDELLREVARGVYECTRYNVVERR